MPILEQYEVWAFENNRWEMIAAFFDQDVASAVAQGRGSQVKLILAKYEDGDLVAQELIAEIGNIRNE
jgi:hypothetical protein